MNDNPTDDVIRNIITRYECEEDEFLRELEGMQRQIPRRTSLYEEVPILGALCSLVGEISKLRRENKALRYQLSVIIEPKRSVVHRVSAILEGRSNIIPKIIGRRTFQQCEIQNGAHERLSTPPCKENLTTSSYSTDISSDVSDPLRTTLTPTRQIPVPPTVLPEMSDSDAEHSIFTEVALPNYGNGINDVRSGRAVMRRSKISSLSKRTSVSSASSRDHSENMVSGRSGFFEIIGLKKKKEKSIESKKETITCKAILKKRKRKISESSSVHSSDNNTPSDKWSLSSMTSKNSIATDKSAAHDESYDNKHSLLQAPKQYHIQRQHKEQENKKYSHDKNSTTVSEESDNDHHGRSISVPKNNRTIHDENEIVRNELVMTKNRNNRLIEQLREKSMEHSKLRTEMSTLQKQIGILRNRCRLNEALEKLSVNDRVITKATATINTVEEKLKIFDDKLKAVKAEMMKNGEAIINQSFREQNAYQSCLEHIERLQRDNFTMLQDKGSDIGNYDQRIRQLLEIMPSYDALYSFTISIVRKLGQLRTSYIAKNIYANRSDFEVMHAQSSLLIIHAQLERLKLQLYEVTRRRPIRPASYHGDDLLQKIIKPQMNLLLPFKLHGARIQKYHRSDSCAMESEIEKNEQSIENEFLRLFDYARCLSRISEFTGVNKAHLESSGISNSSGSHIRDDLQNVNIIVEKDASIRHREEQFRNSSSKIYKTQRNYKSQSAGRPISLHPLINYNHTRPIVSSLQDVCNNVIHGPYSTSVITHRMNLNERPQTISHESLDLFGNELPKYDVPLSHNNASSSDYGAISTKQLCSEKQTITSKRSAAINPSRLPHLRKNVNHTISPPLLSNCDSRSACQLRRNPETVGIIREKNAGSTLLKNVEKSRLPKISSILTEKKKCTSWLNRIKVTK
ncbi:hypothetical protein QQG55_43210 [Brugia pahangi]